MDHTPINEKWNGRQVYVGPRGGKYILDAAGSRRYLREFESVRRDGTKDQKTEKRRPENLIPGVTVLYTEHSRVNSSYEHIFVVTNSSNLIPVRLQKVEDHISLVFVTWVALKNNKGLELFDSHLSSF